MRYPFGRGAHRNPNQNPNPKPDHRKIAARKPHHHRTSTEQAMKVSEQEEQRLGEQMAAWGIDHNQRSTTEGGQ